MKIKSLKLSGPSLEEAYTFLLFEMSPDYQNNTESMFLLCFEKFYFRNNSSQLNMVVVKKEGSYLLIDIIGAAGGQGLLGFTLGSEKRFSRKMQRKIEALCQEKGWKIVEKIDA